MARVVEIREAAVPIATPGRNAVVDYRELTCTLVALVSDARRGGRPVAGFGFHAIGRYAQGIRERFGPRLLEAEGPLDPARVRDLLTANEKPAGHGERSGAVAAIEIAAWDLAAKLAGRPAYAHIADRFGLSTPVPRVRVYAAGGYYSGEGGVAPLEDEIRRHVALGYEQVKIKIGGAPLVEDLSRIEAALALVGGDGWRLAVDANGSFDFASAVEYAEALRPYGLAWFEEPGDPLDHALQAELCRRVDMPYAAGENLCSTQEVVNLVRYAGLRPERDFLQMDPGLSYGVVELREMAVALRELGWAAARVVPHGGTQVALHLAAALALGGSEAYPLAFRPIGGFGSGVEVDAGVAAIPDLPGFGFEDKPELRPLLAELAS